MEFTLDQVLTITGRLDDAPGFDTPRERFRRFLLDRVTTLDAVRLLIQQCRERSGEQSHRALQDVVVLTGRFLGLEASFGAYQHLPGEVPFHGRWQLRRKLLVSVIVCTDQIADVDIDAVSREIAHDASAMPHIALLVATAFYAGKSRLERALAAGLHRDIRLVSLDALLRLCAMVGDGRLTEPDVREVLAPDVVLDARLDLLERVAESGRGGAAAIVDTALVSASPDEEHRFWVNIMPPEPYAPATRGVRALMAARQILGINAPPGLDGRVRVGDTVCVFIPGTGVVGHAHIAGILTDGSRVIRDSKQFTQVLRLNDVMLYDAPVLPGPELARKLELRSGDSAHAAVPISPREFDSITAHALSQAG